MAQSEPAPTLGTLLHLLGPVRPVNNGLYLSSEKLKFELRDHHFFLSTDWDISDDWNSDFFGRILVILSEIFWKWNDFLINSLFIWKSNNSPKFYNLIVNLKTP
jgi:hypothetical protein